MKKLKRTKCPVSDYKNDWNGEYNGHKLVEGTYYYILETKDNVVIKGAFNILN
jgi:gliding motility-associated-like protein